MTDPFQSALERGARKYRNVPTIVDGIRFDSKAEARRYGDLKLLERAGEIRDLRLQPRYPLTVNGVKVCEYRADFAYLDRTGTPITEDVKGVSTKDFIIKAKLFKALLGRDVVLVK